MKRCGTTHFGADGHAFEDDSLYDGGASSTPASVQPDRGRDRTGLELDMPNGTTPKRIQRKRSAGWRMPEGAVYVGRPTRWGNPWRIDRLSAHEYVVINPDGTEAEDGWGGRNFAAQYAVDQYALHTGPMGNYEIERDDFDALRGHDLACWCPLDQPCHADVLIEIANETNA